MLSIGRHKDVTIYVQLITSFFPLFSRKEMESNAWQLIVPHTCGLKTQALAEYSNEHNGMRWFFPNEENSLLNARVNNLLEDRSFIVDRNDALTIFTHIFFLNSAMKFLVHQLYKITIMPWKTMLQFVTS